MSIHEHILHILLCIYTYSISVNKYIGEAFQIFF